MVAGLPKIGSAKGWRYLLTELLIVLIGVFLGMQLSNWNEARIEQGKVDTMLAQLAPQLERNQENFEQHQLYYEVVGDYAETARRGFDRDRNVDDTQFVIAAFQATQVVGVNVIAANWENIFGGGLVREVRDDRVRENLLRVLAFDVELANWQQLETDYRRKVRSIIPSNVQAALFENCGDILDENGLIINLTATCDISFEPDEMRAIADELRSEPNLDRELQWHLAKVRTYVFNRSLLNRAYSNLSEAIRAAN